MNTNDIIESIKEIEAFKARNLLDKYFKLYEESGELCGAYLSYKKSYGSEYKNKTREDLIEETVDIILCVLSIIKDNTFYLEYSMPMIDTTGAYKSLDDCIYSLIKCIDNFRKKECDCDDEIIFFLNNILFILNVSESEFEDIIEKKLTEWREKVSI